MSIDRWVTPDLEIRADVGSVVTSFLPHYHSDAEELTHFSELLKAIDKSSLPLAFVEGIPRQTWLDPEQTHLRGNGLYMVHVEKQYGMHSIGAAQYWIVPHDGKQVLATTPLYVFEHRVRQQDDDKILEIQSVYCDLDRHVAHVLRPVQDGMDPTLQYLGQTRIGGEKTPRTLPVGLNRTSIAKEDAVVRQYMSRDRGFPDHVMDIDFEIPLDRKTNVNLLVGYNTIEGPLLNSLIRNKHWKSPAIAYEGTLPDKRTRA